jgi:hypothetical protein
LEAEMRHEESISARDVTIAEINRKKKEIRTLREREAALQRKDGIPCCLKVDSPQMVHL